MGHLAHAPYYQIQVGMQADLGLSFWENHSHHGDGLANTYALVFAALLPVTSGVFDWIIAGWDS